MDVGRARAHRYDTPRRTRRRDASRPLVRRGRRGRPCRNDYAWGDDLEPSSDLALAGEQLTTSWDIRIAAIVTASGRI